jgi:hypothetical protein
MKVSEPGDGVERSASSTRRLTRRKTWISVALLLWVVVLSFFFYVRFSFVFYDAHREAIESLVERLLGT